MDHYYVAHYRVRFALRFLGPQIEYLLVVFPGDLGIPQHREMMTESLCGGTRDGTNLVQV